VIVELFGDLQLEHEWFRISDRAAGNHVIDALADSHSVFDAQKIKRVLVGYKEQIRVSHDVPAVMNKDHMV
jgi:hypothetical protein